MFSEVFNVKSLQYIQIRQSKVHSNVLQFISLLQLRPENQSGGTFPLTSEISSLEWGDPTMGTVSENHPFAVMHKLYIQKEMYIICSTNMPGNTKERSRC